MHGAGGGDTPGASLSPSWDPLTSFQGAFQGLISSCPRRWGGAVIPTNQMGKLRRGPWKSLRQKTSSQLANLPRSQKGERCFCLFACLFAFSRGEGKARLPVLSLIAAPTPTPAQSSERTSYARSCALYRPSKGKSQTEHNSTPERGRLSTSIY